MTQSQIWNAKHKKTKRTWVSNMDIGDFNQSEAQIYLCSTLVLHSESNKMFTLVHKKKHPGDEGDQISSSPIY